jgi:hypothetical protein
MVQGLGPRIAPRSNDVPAYASAPIAQQVTIGAYVGIPLKRADGELCGTLCAIHPAARPQEHRGGTGARRNVERAAQHAAGTDIVVNRLRKAFADAGIHASIGSARRDSARGLQQAWEDADSAMYSNKPSRYALADAEHLSAV